MRMLGRATLYNQALSEARNLIETAIATPCAAPYACAAGFLCSLAEIRVASGDGREDLIKITAVVRTTEDSGGVNVELSALARRNAVCD